MLKGAEYVPSVRRLLRRLRELEPDVVHVQWLALPRLDIRWLQRVATGLPTVYTAHHALPRDVGARVDARRRVYDIVRRVVVHSRQRVDDLAALGVARERVAYIPHPVFELDTPTDPAPPAGSTLLFFGLIRGYKGLDVLVRDSRSCPRRGSSSQATRSTPSSPCSSLRASCGSAGASSGGSASFPTKRSCG